MQQIHSANTQATFRPREVIEETPTESMGGNDNGFWSDVLDRAETETHIVPTVTRHLEMDFTPDPLFSIPTAEDIETRFRDKGIAPTEIPLSMWQELGGVQSQDEFEYRLGRVEERIVSRRELQEKGAMRAFLVELASYATDPVGLAIDATVTRGMRGATIGKRFISGGLRSVSAEAIIEGALAADGESPTIDQVAMGMGAAFLMGGAFGAVLGPRDFDAINEATKTLATGKPSGLYRIDPETGKVHSVGAMQTERTNLPSNVDYKFTAWEQLEDALGFFDGHSTSTFGRFDMSSWLLRSNNPTIRKIGSRFFNNPVVKKGEDAQIALETRAKTVWGQPDAQRAKSTEDAFLKYLKRTTGKGRTRSFFAHQERDRFMRMVGEYRRSKGQIDAPEEVVEASKAQTRFYQDLLKRLKEAKVPGAEKIEADEWWQPRILSKERMDEFLMRAGRAEDGGLNAQRIVQDAFQGAIEQARKMAGVDWDEELSKVVAQAYTKRLIGIDDSLAKPFSIGETSGFDLSDVSDLRRFIRSYADLDEDSITKADEMLDNVEKLFKKKDKANQKGTTPDFLKSRLLLDENFEFTYRDTDGNEQVGRIADFFENNTEDLAFNYGRSVGGEATYYQALGMSSGEVQAAVEDARKLSRFHESDPTMPSARDVRVLEQAHRSIMGQRPDDMGEAGRRIINALKSSAFVKLMGSSAINAAVEAMTLMAMHGPMRILRGMSSYQNVLKGLEGSGNNTGLVRQAIMLSGGVTETFVRNMKGRSHMLDTAGRPKNLGGSRTGRFFGFVEETIEGAKRAASHYNGLAHVTDVSRRFSAALALDQLDDILTRGARKPSWWDSRRKSWTLNDQRMTRVQEYLKSENVIRGPKDSIVDLNFEKMPLDVRTALEDYMYSVVSESIQEIDRGNLPFFMTHPLGSLVFQFRSFETASWVRHTLKDINQQDVLGLTKFISTAAMASIVYMGRVHLFNAFNEEKIKEQATVRNALATGVSYSVNAGLLPSIIDTAAQYTLGTNIINQYGRRTSGLESSLGINPQSIPGYGVIKDVETIVQMPGRILRGGAGVETGISQQEAQAIFGITGLKTMWFTRPFTQGIIDSLDKESQSKRRDEAIDLWAPLEE